MNRQIFLGLTIIFTTYQAHAQCNINTSSACTCFLDPQANLSSIVCRFPTTDSSSGDRQPIILNTTTGVEINIDVLDLSSNGLEHLPSNIFQGIGMIGKLILRNNSFNSITDITIPLANTISELDISENNLSVLNVTELIEKFPRLLILNVRSNKLTALTELKKPSGTYKLQRVDLLNNLLETLDANFWAIAEHIDLSYNKIQVINQIPQCDVQSINLAGNPLNSLAGNLFINLQSLQHLVLSNCSLQSLHINTFMECNSLRTLNISHNTLTLLPVNLFKDLGNLVSLDASKNMLTRTEAAMFNGLHDSLETLTLSQNDLQHLDPNSFDNMVELRTLDLHGNSRLQNVELISFPKHLQTLNLDDCNVGKINDCYFYLLKDLTSLGLKGNTLSCSCHIIWIQTFIQKRIINQQGSLERQNIWTCKFENGNETKVHLLNSLCPVLKPQVLPEHCQENISDNATYIGELKLDVSTTNSKEIILKWTTENSTLIQGYRVIIKTEGGELFRSTVLPKGTREYIVKGVDPSSDYSACLEVLDEERQVLHEECRNQPYRSFQALVGIMAGTVFLVPCLFVLSYIIYKDRQKMKAEAYAQLNNADSSEADQSSVVKVIIDDDDPTVNGTVNGSVKPKSILKSKPSENSGHDNTAFQTDSEKLHCVAIPVSFVPAQEKGKNDDASTNISAVDGSNDSTCNTKL